MRIGSVTNIWALTPPPTTPPGIDNSMVELDGREKTDPEGRRSPALLAPLRICNRTGVLGAVNWAPLTVNVPALVCRGDPSGSVSPPPRAEWEHTNANAKLSA